MTEKELLNLINRGESQTVSLKFLKAKPSVLARPMVSFSNTNDGIIIIGVDDKTRKVCGAKTTKQKEEGLDNIHKAANTHREYHTFIRNGVDILSYAVASQTRGLRGIY